MTDPSKFLPKNHDKYYRYEGSLTTPDFGENVSWAVLRTPFRLDAEDIKALILDFEKPARFPEPLNRRFVLATFRADRTAKTPDHGATTKPKSRTGRSKS